MTIDLPADTGRAVDANNQRQAQILFRVEPVAGGHALHDFRPMLGAEAEGAQAAFVAAVGPDQAEDAEIFFIDELRRRNQCPVDLPPLFG